MSKLDQELVDKYNSLNDINGGCCLRCVGEDNCKEAIATCYNTASSI